MLPFRTRPDICRLADRQVTTLDFNRNLVKRLIMNGTLALWYESKTSEERRSEATRRRGGEPSVRLHVNLWRDIGKDFNFLDVGFLLEEVGDLDRLYLYIPGPIDPTCFFDLSSALKDADTLNAVFNEVAVIKREADEHFIVATGSSKLRVIHHVKPDRDLAVYPINVPGRGRGTIVALKTAFCARIGDQTQADHEHYVRLRIFLRGEARNLFSTEESAPGVGLSLTQDVLETTEFRLNERRSYPPLILQRSMLGPVSLKSVHYFLIRSKNHQLGSQHQNFRKVRNLEPDIWTSYLRVGLPSPGRFGRRPQADGMIIYQWRAIATEEEKPLDDFIAYASFRIVQAKIPAYLVAILAIGGVGSALLNVGIAALHWMYGELGWPKPSSGLSNLYVGAMLGVFALSPMILSRLRGRRN